MNNLLIISYGNRIGGSELQCHKLKKIIDNPFWITISHTNDKNENSDLNVDQKIFFKKLSLIQIFKISSEISEIIKKRNILNIYSSGFIPSIIGMLIKFKNRNINFVTAFRQNIRWMRLSHKFIYLLIFFFSNKIETNSHYYYCKLNKFFSKKIYLINNIILKKKKTYVPKIKKKIFTVGYVGNLRPIKNFKLLIKVFQILLNNYSDIKIKFIGEDYKNNLTKELKIRNYKNFKFIDKVDNKNIFIEFENIDLIILTSIQESNPNIVLEANSCGIPVLMTSFESAEKIIINGINGYLVNSKPYEFVTKILKLKENKYLLFKLSKSSYQFYNNNPDLDYFRKFYNNNIFKKKFL